MNPFSRRVGWACFGCWAAVARLQSQVLNGSFEIDPWPVSTPSGWQGGSILGQQIGLPMISVPGGIFGGFIQVPASPPIGKDGCCSAGIHSGTGLRQTVLADPDRAYELAFWAQSMGQLNPPALLRARVLASNGDALTSAEWTLPSGGPGSQDFREYRLYLPPRAQTGPVTIEFSNLETKPDAQAVVDAVRWTAVAAGSVPRLDPPRRAADKWQFSWTDSAPAQSFQSAPSPSGPWTDVPLTGVRSENGKRVLELSIELLTTPRFFRTRAAGK